MTSYTGKHLYYYHVLKLYGIIVEDNNSNVITVLTSTGHIVKTKITYDQSQDWYIISGADKHFHRFILKP